MKQKQANRRDFLKKVVYASTGTFVLPTILSSCSKGAKLLFSFSVLFFALQLSQLQSACSVPNESSNPFVSNQYTWIENDSTYALAHNDRVIWQYNFNTQYGKPFFHPIHVNNNNITCLRPDDHPWHLGQWFSWKYINETNYWEYLRGGYASEGVTNIKSIELQKRPDNSAEIRLEIEYHPQNQEAVLSEQRIIEISPPQKDGSIWMDYHFTFSPLDERVIIDRTPLAGEPNGQSWGGYGGLSVRFNMDFKESVIISDASDGDSMHGAKADWLYMGFKGVDDKRTGSMIMINEETKREGEAWYVTDNPEIPFYFINPAYVFLRPEPLNKREAVSMKYRILHLEGAVSKEELTNKYKQYSNP